MSAHSRIERFSLSAHADRGGLLGMIARYALGKVILTYGELRARSNTEVTPKNVMRPVRS